MILARDMDRGLFVCPQYLVQHGCFRYRDILDANTRSIVSKYSERYGE